MCVKEEGPVLYLLPIFNREWIRLLEHVLKCIDSAELLLCFAANSVHKSFYLQGNKALTGAASEQRRAEVLHAT